MKQLCILTTTAVAVLFVGTANAQDQPQTQEPSQGRTPQYQSPSSTQNQTNRLKQSADHSFAMKALQAGMAEVELGKLATERASNDKVKQFGQRMVDDHSKAGDELKSIASQKGITAPMSLDAKAEALKLKLSSLNGAAFDKAYMQDMVSDHKKDIAEFEKEANSGTDPEIKAFAAKTLPTLKEHLQLAEAAWNEVKGADRGMQIVRAEGADHFDTVQMLINVMDHHFRSFGKLLGPEALRQKVGILGMKSMGSGIILKSNTAGPLECLHDVMHQPVSVVIAGVENQEDPDQALNAARTFKPVSEQQVSAITSKTAKGAGAGTFEIFKTSSPCDSTAKHPEWLGGESSQGQELSKGQ